MEVDFTKMHGAGNDFVVIDERARPLGLAATQIAWLADRRLGIGCDQLILLQPPRAPGMAAFLRFYNSDGSESGACGNGTRCAAAFVGGVGMVRLHGGSGPLLSELLGTDRVRVDMGAAGLGWRDLPLSREADTLDLHAQVGRDAAACSMGNPHATLFVGDLGRVDAAAEGAELERHALFPERANIGFAQVLAPDRIRLIVWERGAGLTPACGSGACAAVVNAHRRGLTARACAVEMPGGVLQVEWREDGHVLLAGPTATVFTGRIAIAS